MTKTLTEQRREGTLPEGWYYTIITGFTDKEKMMLDYFIPELHHFEIKPTECIKEVLAPVPSYDEWKHTKEKLKKATELNCNHAYKTNKRRTQINNLKNENNQLREQLKEKNIKLNELRHQRNEANTIIEDIRPFIQASMSRQTFTRILNYEEKWGVK